MTRISELEKKYPTVPQEVVVKWEVVSHGVRDTGDLDKIGTWQKAGEHYSYQSYDHDITLKEYVEKRPARLKDGRILRPGHFYMKNGIGAAIRIDTSSPYEIRDSGDGRLFLFEGEEKLDISLFFPHPKPRVGPELVTGKGTPVSTLISPRRRCFQLMPVRYCEYFAHRDQCKFCNFNGTQDDSRSIGLSRPVTVNLEETVEAYRILSDDTMLLEGRFEMGGFMSSEQEASIHFDFVESIAKGAPYKPVLTVQTEAMHRKDMQRLKDAGLDCMAIQMEAWDPEIFAEVCPGKAKHAPHEQWLESLLDAVDVFGAGNVGGKIIAGLSLIPPNGHTTWQQARDSHIEGNRWMIKNGVMPTFSHVRMPPGSVYWADYQTLRQKLPPTEYFLDVALDHHATMMEYGLYKKLNKLMYCGLCCIPTIYSGELGILALAGDPGKWMADVVPPESNWLAQFISSVSAQKA
ncbi:MAG: hypothetical protein Q7O66_01290 [Dehalococcoidia bacterium]|nr:hypothetical protein [Dehalococcoidia bacterium]